MAQDINKLIKALREGVVLVQFSAVQVTKYSSVSVATVEALLDYE